jgi:Ser/Thr protein kinase RdoA (MazF antagonist)
MTEEVPLTGGRSTAVVRVGDTVRRQAGPWTPTIHAYLRHLRAQGFLAAPEVLGIDAEGREILRFIPGETLGDALDPAEPKSELAITRPWTASMRSDRALAEIGTLHAALHAAARGYRPEAPTWREYELPMHEGEIVCHGDPGPWNVVYRGGVPVALIDWDSAHPERPLIELASVAWKFVPLGGEDELREIGFEPPFETARRLRILCDAYGGVEPAAMLAALSERPQLAAMRLRYWQPLRSGAAAALLHGWASSLEWLERNADELRRSLT